ncbi:tyrosine-type recombinase/integrase [Larkinella terrae]|nr:site-specific integrase [Larkinella terrae]
MSDNSTTTAKFPYKEPFISKPADDDLTKQWVVEYGIWSKKKQCIVRKRVVLSGNTVAQRLADAKEIIAELKRILKKGEAYVDEVEPTQAKNKKNPKVDPPPTRSSRVKHGSVSKILILEAIDQFMSFKEKTTKPNTIMTYRTHVNTLLKYLKRHQLQKKALVNFTDADALHFLDEATTVERLGNRSRNNARDAIFTLFEHFRKRKHIEVNPFKEIGKLSFRRYKHMPYTFEQRDQIKQFCLETNQHQLLLFISFIYYGFMRPHGEVSKLKVKDLRERTIAIDADNAKDIEAEHIQIPPGLEKLIDEYQLRSYPPEAYLFTKTGQPGSKHVDKLYFYRRHRKILAKLGFTDKRFDLYGWKHTGVIALWVATQNIRLIQRQCRHSNAQQTEEYLRDLGIIVKDTDIDKFPDF